MSSAISLRNVVKHYRRGKESVEVLHGLNLEIPAGEFVSLMGPSGSGKTTILNLVGGLDRATSGEVIVGGEHLESLSGGQLTKWRGHHIGFIFQFYNLMPMLSAAGNVELPLLLTKLSKAERKRRVEIALDIVGLKERASHKPGEMSGGQQQRVGIARAVAMEPRLLLLDEITSALDPELVGEVLDVVRGLATDGMTMLMVTHEMQFARDAGHRVVFMDAGRVAEAGVPREVLGNPQSERLRKFLRRIELRTE